MGSADNTTRIDITASADQANREFKAWASNVQTSSEAVKSSLAGVAKATAASQAQLKAGLEGIEKSVSGVVQRYAAFVALLAGGGALKKFISDANDWNAGVGKMAAQLGITTERASALQVALRRLGIDNDAYLNAAQKLSRQVQTNGQAFEVLGVKVRDAATGAYRPIIDVMGEVNSKLSAIKNPLEQNIAGQQIYRQSWGEVRSMLRLTTEQMQAAEIRARELGLIVGPEGVAMTKQYAAQMRDLKLVGEAVERQFGNQLLPVFTQTGAWMANEGPRMAKVFGDALHYVSASAGTLYYGFLKVGAVIGGVVAVIETWQTKGLAASHKLADQLKLDLSSIQSDYEKYLANMAKPPTAASAEPDLGRGPKYKFGREGEDPEAKSRLATWETALAERKAAITRAGLEESVLREMSKADELKYWQDIRAQAGLTQTEKVALTRKSADVEMAMVRERFDVTVKTLEAEAAQYKHNTAERLRIEEQIQRHYAKGTKEYEAAQQRINEIRRQADEQARQVAASRAQADRDARLQTIALEEQTAQQAQQLGLLTMQQLLQMQRQFEQQRFQIAMQALQERLALAQADPDRSVVELENIHRQIEQLEQQHQLKLAQIRGQAQQDATRYERGVIEGIGAQTQSIISRLGTQIRGLRDLFRASLEGLVQIGLGIIGQMAAEWIKTQIAALVFRKNAAVDTIAAKSAEAGAGGVASMAAAPYPMNLYAPEFGAAMAAAALAFAPAASAALGFDIPAGVQPIVQTHAREMILPARLADTVRDMARVYAGAQAVGAPQLAAGPSVVMHVSIAHSNFADRRNRDQVLADFYAAAARAARRNN